jgi:hypothetical protein
MVAHSVRWRSRPVESYAVWTGVVRGAGAWGCTACKSGFSSCRLASLAGLWRRRSQGLKSARTAKRQTTSVKARPRAVARTSLMRSPGWPATRFHCSLLPKERSKYTSPECKEFCEPCGSLCEFVRQLAAFPGSTTPQMPGVFAYLIKSLRVSSGSVHTSKRAAADPDEP